MSTISPIRAVHKPTPSFVRLIENLPNIFQPVIRTYGELTGLNVTLLVGGPIPLRKGQVNVYGYVIYWDSWYDTDRTCT